MKKVQALSIDNFFKSYFALLFRPVITKSPYGVLVCKPLGQEGIRTNKAVIQLCREISNQGIVAMTFDYYGTGDSSGKFEDITVDTCAESIQQCATYFKSQCDLEDIIVICIRAGALFTEVINQTISPKAFVLWHAVLNGKQYFNELQRQHRTWLLGSFVRKDGRFENKKELLGFMYSDAFLKTIGEIEIDVRKLSNDKVFLLIDNPDSLQNGLPGLDGIQYVPSKNNNFWVKTGLGESIVPVHDIRSISSWLQTIGVKVLM